VSLRDLAVIRLTDSYQAPGTVFYARAELRKLFSRHAQIVNRFLDIIVIASNSA
jgi:hypothetical protein